ncbi:hypothetical protein SEUCBS139899_008826 [Sporothrix eucalyptigena]
MASPLPVALILGAGANIGQAVARAFTSEGCRIALVARSPPKTREDGILHIRGVLADPSSVAAASGLGDALTLPLADFAQSLAINTTYAAAQIATAGFKTLPVSGMFNFTGNATN